MVLFLNNEAITINSNLMVYHFLYKLLIYNN